MAPKAAALGSKGESNANFRARRLSVSDIDTSEFDKTKAASTPDGPKARGRRMSMSPEMGVVKPKSVLPFPLEVVGTYSCHGVEPGMRAGETSAKINQDRGCVCYPFGTDCPEKYKHQALFCVYDGHGALGDKVSHYVMNNIQEKLDQHASLVENPGKALRETFVTVDEDLKKNKDIDAELSGTTAVVLLLRELPDGTYKSWTACAGDSRATLAIKDPKTGKLKVQDLSFDQKPDTPEEAKRIRAKGGFISPPEEEWGGPARVWLDANMTLPGLAMARSIGDHLVSSVGVVADPEVLTCTMPFTQQHWDTHNAKPEGKVWEGIPQFICMASDGVWEFIESEAAVALVGKFIDDDATVACTRLIETAAAKWRQEEGDYRDDITAICVKLPNLFAAATPVE